MSLNGGAMKVSLAQAARCLRIAFLANVPIALWSAVGVGKSSIVRQSVPKGWKLYDVRLSDKEPSDLGGIPFPDPKTGKVVWLVGGLLPFDCDEKCIVFLDEFDRCEMAVMNMALQILLDRSINGHKLSPNARLVIAGNGASDVGTIPLSKAAATRMCHLYVDGESDQALNAWLDWAKNEAVVSPALQGFAKYRADVWVSNGHNAPVEELAFPCPRSWVTADALWQASRVAKFEVSDIVLPLLAGCVGLGAARELNGWYKMAAEVPSIEEIEADPENAKLPGQVSCYFALGMTLAREVSKNHDLDQADRFARYISRWPREQAQFCFVKMLEFEARVATSPAYRAWSKGS